VRIEPGHRYFLLDLDAPENRDRSLMASACKALVTESEDNSLSYAVEGIARTPAVVVLRASKAPQKITLEDQVIEDFEFSEAHGLLWIRFENEARPRTLSVAFDGS
jgi:hypothetical protein